MQFVVVFGVVELAQAALLARWTLAGLVAGGAHLVGIVLGLNGKRWAAVALVVGAGVQCFATFPVTANHHWLGGFVSLVLAVNLAGADDDVRRGFGALVAVLVFSIFWAGITKLVHGMWFHGQTLASLLATRTDVRPVLALLLPSDELARLSALHLAAGAGPVVVPAGPARWLSNGVWFIELVLPVTALGARRVARHFWWLAGLVALGLQVVAHEWDFALVLVAICALAAPARVWRLGARGVVVVAIALMAARVGGVDHHFSPAVEWPP